MRQIIVIHNLQSDIPDKTWKEKNADLKHNYSIGSLVEIKDTGARAFIVEHTRDCDMTPLYNLHLDYKEYLQWKNNPYYNKNYGGYSEESLKLIERNGLGGGQKNEKRKY